MEAPRQEIFKGSPRFKYLMKKVVVIGPESTGKSTLCQQLAAHYGVSWVPEYARQYLLQHGTNYSYDNLLTIAKGQVALEEEYLSRAQGPALFIDTDMYVMKVWCEFVYGNCHQWILDCIAERRYDFYFLCNIDLPWVQDGLREYPDIENRQKLYRMYHDILVNQSVPWMEISGSEEERLQQAIEATDKLLRK
jgi:NadR type nicotinamide-nucleotide adenylyltransferase